MNALDQFESQVEALLIGLQPAARKKKFQKIGRALRKSNQSRIKQQINSDGSAYVPRKKSPRTINRAKKMMMGLRKAKRMKIKVSDDGLQVGFGGFDAVIASVHQFGGQANVIKGITHDYHARELLGINTNDQQIILDILLDDEL